MVAPLSPMTVAQQFFLSPNTLSKNVCGKVAMVALSILVGVATFGLVHFGVWYFSQKKCTLGLPPGGLGTGAKVAGVADPLLHTAGVGATRRQTFYLAPGTCLGTVYQSGLDPRKEKLLRQAQEYYYGSPDMMTELETHRLTNADEFCLLQRGKASPKTIPEYFKNTVRPFASSSPLGLPVIHEYYDYQETPDHEDYWIDFANCSLGGGCFTHGFVQEEMMVHEMPDFAEHVASAPAERAGWCNISTRHGTCPDGSEDYEHRMFVLQGTPDPYLMKGLHRVQAISQDLYGRKLDGYTSDEAKAKTVRIDPPQCVNVLAIAAPKLHQDAPPREQWSVNTLQDMFNTLMAGFTLVQRSTPPGKTPMIHSGAIGCGAFYNDRRAVFLLHCLAAHQLGCQVQLHGYTEDEEREFLRDWRALVPQLNGQTLEGCISTISTHGLSTS